MSAFDRRRRAALVADSERSIRSFREETRALGERATKLAQDIRLDRVAREVDRAIERGSIMLEARERWLEEFGDDPDLAAERLDPTYTGSGRQLSEDEERAQIAAGLGLAVEDVI